jgi:hypothetical protein
LKALLECADAVFERGDLLDEAGCDWGLLGGGGNWGFGDRAAEEVHPAGFSGAGLALHEEDEWLFAGGEAFEGGDDGGVVVEGVHALGAGAELGGCLWTAEEQRAEHGDFVAAEVEDVANAVLEFGDAAVGVGADEAEAFKVEEGGADIGFGELGDGLAIVLLVAGVDGGVERERIVLRRGDLFFDERAEDAGFGGRELEHEAMVSVGGVGR